jgi:hypothetical protein
MTLPEYFDSLIRETCTSPLSADRKVWLLDNLTALKTLSEFQPDQQRRNRPISLNLWHGSLSDLVDAGVFKEVGGDKKLKRKLRLFLGI